MLKNNRKFHKFIFLFIAISIILNIKIQYSYSFQSYLEHKLESEKPTPHKEDIADSENKYKTQKERTYWVESARGSYSKASTQFYFSDIYLNLGDIVSDKAVLDAHGRPIKTNQIIRDPNNPHISQQRSLSNIQYDRDDKPISYREEVFIAAEDYLTDSIIRLLSTTDVYKIYYDESKKPITILGNTEVTISDDKGNELLSIKGSFTKRATFNLKGNVEQFSRYGIDNVIVAAGAGGITITTPPLSRAKGVSETRVAIVNISDEETLQYVLKGQTFINQLLSKFGLAELFYKAFYTEKYDTPLHYLHVRNTPEEIMSLANITAAFKTLIKERQQAYVLFQNDIDLYYDKLSKALFENTELWWGEDVNPQNFYAGSDKILSKREYREMIDDAIVALSLSVNATGVTTGVSKNILTLEQYLRTQMVMNSELIYIQNLKNAVSDMNREISLAIQKLDRPVLVNKKGELEAVIVLPARAKGKE